MAPMFQSEQENVAVEKPGRMTVLGFGGIAGLNCGFKGFRLELTIALQQDFYFTFGLFQFLATGT